MNMTIKIKVTNALTNEVEINSTVSVPDNMDVITANHEVFREMFRNSTVTFTMEKGGFITSMPYNQETDEMLVERGLMTFKEYKNKWYAPKKEVDLPFNKCMELSKVVDFLLKKGLTHTAYYVKQKAKASTTVEPFWIDASMVKEALTLDNGDYSLFRELECEVATYTSIGY